MNTQGSICGSEVRVEFDCMTGKGDRSRAAFLLQSLIPTDRPFKASREGVVA